MMLGGNCTQHSNYTASVPHKTNLQAIHPQQKTFMLKLQQNVDIKAIITYLLTTHKPAWISQSRLILTY
jgi:hypothetical protein